MSLFSAVGIYRVCDLIAPLRCNYSLITAQKSTISQDSNSRIYNNDVMITVVIMMAMMAIMMTRMKVTAIITMMMMTKHKARQTSDSKTDYNIVHYMLLLECTSLPRGTPNLCVHPIATSQPNSPGGLSIVRARRSVAHTARAYAVK